MRRSVARCPIPRWAGAGLVAPAARAYGLAVLAHLPRASRGVGLVGQPGVRDRASCRWGPRGRRRPRSHPRPEPRSSPPREVRGSPTTIPHAVVGASGGAGRRSGRHAGTLPGGRRGCRGAGTSPTCAASCGSWRGRGHGRSRTSGWSWRPCRRPDVSANSRSTRRRITGSEVSSGRRMTDTSPPVSTARDHARPRLRPRTRFDGAVSDMCSTVDGTCDTTPRRLPCADRSAICCR